MEEFISRSPGGVDQEVGPKKTWKRNWLSARVCESVVGAPRNMDYGFVDEFMTPTLVWNEPDQALYLFGGLYSTVLYRQTGWKLIRIDPTDWSWTIVGEESGYLDTDPIPVVTPDGAVWVPNVRTEYLPETPGTSDDGDWPGYLRYVPGGPPATPTAFLHDPYWGNDAWPAFTEGNNEYVFIPRPNNSVWFLSDWDGNGWQLDPDNSVHQVPELDTLSYDTDFIATSPSAAETAMWAYSPSEGYHLWRVWNCCGGRGKCLPGDPAQRVHVRIVQRAGV